ncbi:MAG: DUF1800 domain-containing protein [Cocleimonas sp.]
MGNLSFSEARHLVERTGIGAEWKTIERFQTLTRPQAVEYLLKNRDHRLPRAPGMSPWPKMVSLRGNMRRKKMIKRISRDEGKKLQAWWVSHLLKTQSPFLERMTLFWHNHFPSSIAKTTQPSMLHKQNLSLRKNAFGNFGQMLHDIARDPAMLLYLDGYVSTKEEPNENFARELLELFTIGLGKYSENDMREAARAFTGWGIDDRNGRFIFRAEDHDTGVKTFMGKRGKFKGEDIINILLQHPSTAERIAIKMWHEFVSIARPDMRVIKQWAHAFRSSHYDISTLIRSVLNSQAFWAKHHRGALIKSPIQLTIGTLRALPYSPAHTDITHNLNIMGQAVFAHPSVKGWEGGKTWISTQSILRRNSMMNNLSSGNLNERKNRGGIAAKMPDINPQQMREWLLAIPPLQAPPTTSGKQRLARAFVLDPAYQVL